MTSSHQQNLRGRKMSPFQAVSSEQASPKFSLFPAIWLDAEGPVRLLRPTKMVETLGGSVTE